jgi:hypothetical protein
MRPPSEIAAPSTTNTGLDERIVRISIQVNGVVKQYENLFISAVGVKYGNPLQNECEITIYNLDRATQDYILTETTPYNYNKTRKTVILEAGRQSYGTTIIFIGDIVYSSVTQPPDVGVTLRCLTSNFKKGSVIYTNQPALSTIEQVTNALANQLEVRAQFEATNKTIGNYSFNGSTLKQLELLASMGQLDVFIDDDTLVVKNAGAPLRSSVRQLSASTGLVGIPEFTERGVRLKFFIDNKTVLGGAIELHSEKYPATNGTYVIYQLAFIITNRLTPFYYIADCFRIPPSGEEATNG